AVVQRPLEVRAGRGAALRILRLLVHQDEVGGGDRPGVGAAGVGDDQVEVLDAAPVGGRGGRGERVGVRRDEVAGGVPEQGVGHVVLQRVGELDVADRAFDLLHVRGDALVALAADAVGPLHRLAFADGRLPGRADLGQVVGEVEGGAGAVGALHQV